MERNYLIYDCTKFRRAYTRSRKFGEFGSRKDDRKKTQSRKQHFCNALESPNYIYQSQTKIDQFFP